MQSHSFVVFDSAQNHCTRGSWPRSTRDRPRRLGDAITSGGSEPTRLVPSSSRAAPPTTAPLCASVVSWLTTSRPPRPSKQGCVRLGGRRPPSPPVLAVLHSLSAATCSPAASETTVRVRSRPGAFPVRQGTGTRARKGCHPLDWTGLDWTGLELHNNNRKRY